MSGELNIGHIGPYELLGRLGSGGMGEVFLARATGAAGFEAYVVIKQLLPHLAGNPDFVQRFVDEGKLVVQLRHAGIAQVLNLGEDAGRLYMAMEYVEGNDLREVLRLARAAEVRPSVEVVCTILVRVLEALDYAHRLTGADGRPLGIIHRDVSPSNVMLSSAGDVKLLDFGIARAAERSAESISGSIQGKYSYMSPEQALSAPSLDGRSDQFSLGVMAWEALLGSRPFDGATDIETLDRIRGYDPGSIADAMPTIPADVAAVVDRLLHKDADRRFSSCDEARKALQSHLNRTESTMGARELADWLETLEAKTPASLRDRDAAASIDDILRLSLDAGGGHPPATHTVTSTPAALGLGAPVPLSPSTAAPSHLTPGAQLTMDSVSTPPPRRSRFAWTLVVLNLLLLGAVGWLVYTATIDDTPTTTTSRGTVPDVAPVAIDPEPVVADASVGSAVDVGAAVDDGAVAAHIPVDVPAPETTVKVPRPGLQAGLALASAVAKLPEGRRIVVRASPSAAILNAPGHPPSQGSLSIWLRPGQSLAVSARSAGYSRRTITLDDASTAQVQLALRLLPRGKVTFRFFPANAAVTIDGRTVSTGGNLVSRELSVGPHRVVVTAPGGAKAERSFEVRADEVTNLKTLTAKPAAGHSGSDGP